MIEKSPEKKCLKIFGKQSNTISNQNALFNVCAKLKYVANNLMLTCNKLKILNITYINIINPQ